MSLNHLETFGNICVHNITEELTALQFYHSKIHVTESFGNICVRHITEELTALQFSHSKIHVTESFGNIWKQLHTKYN